MRAAEQLHELARDVLLIATHGPRTAGALALEAIANGADLIIAAGGDGTISEVVDGVAHSHIPLGILPAGTANVLAHEIGLKRNVVDAARQLPFCSAQRVSLGAIETDAANLHYFLLMAGVGFDAQVIYRLSAGWKDKMGKLSYFLGGLRGIGGTLPEFEAVIDGVPSMASFLLVSKVRNYGGDFQIAAEVHLRDETFETVRFEGEDSWRYLRYLAGVAMGRLSGMQGVSFARCKTVELRPREGTVYLQADGELIGRIPATIRIVPRALTLLMPPETPGILKKLQELIATASPGKEPHAR